MREPHFFSAYAMKSSIHSFVILIHPWSLAAWDISVKESIENLRIAQ